MRQRRRFYSDGYGTVVAISQCCAMGEQREGREGYGGERFGRELEGAQEIAKDDKGRGRGFKTSKDNKWDIEALQWRLRVTWNLNAINLNPVWKLDNERGINDFFLGLFFSLLNLQLCTRRLRRSRLVSKSLGRVLRA